MSETNGRNKLATGLGGGAIVLALAGYAWTQIQTDLARVQVHDTAIAVIQQKELEQERQNVRVEDQLDRLNRKMDLLLRDRGIRNPEPER
jgi:hypothetical protein